MYKEQVGFFLFVFSLWNFVVAVALTFFAARTGNFGVSILEFVVVGCLFFGIIGLVAKRKV